MTTSGPRPPSFFGRETHDRSLGRKPDSHPRLRGTTGHAPEPAALSGQGEPVLAWLTLPCPSSSVATDLDDVRLVFGDGGHPIEPVAAEIDEQAARIEPASRASIIRAVQYSGWVPVSTTRYGASSSTPSACKSSSQIMST